MRIGLVATAALLLAAACGGDDEEVGTSTTADGRTSTSGATTTAAHDAVSLTRSCTNPDDGYSIAYAEGWFTNSGDVVPPCELFDTRELVVEPATEPDAPVIADVEQVSFAVAAEPSRGEEVLSRRESEIGGDDAVRLETVATPGAPMQEPGDRRVRWVVRVAEDRTFVATARGTASVDAARAAEVLDAMMATLELTR